jgi:sterol desaturase/sphingolipid hydroxylase (fatty acid hydroxylase superfamily)
MFNPTEFSILQWLLSPALVFGRYAFYAALGFAVFYVWKRRAWFHLKIQQRFPQREDYLREVLHSLLTSFIFAFVAWLCLGTPLREHTQFYTDARQFGWAYLVASIPLTLLIHDAYFYWIHRLMHLPIFYRKIHLTHHRSVNPSPWAAYAFHPLEAVLEAGIMPILLIIMPLHPISFFGFVTAMLVFNVYGHLGYELFPRKIYDHPLGKWLNTSIYHNLHHEKFHGNYGLYFTIWDRLCGTLRADSAEKVEEVYRGRWPESTGQKVDNIGV